MTKDAKKSLRDEEIDKNLRRVFQKTLEEEVPDRFRVLLSQLREKESGKDGDA